MKSTNRKPPQERFPYLLILHAKHDPCYFYVGSKEDLVKSLEEVFEINEDYYPSGSDRAYCEEKIAEIEKEIREAEAARAICSGELQEALKDRISLKHSSLRHYKLQLADCKTVEMIREGKKELIPNYVWARRDAEHERLSMEGFSNRERK